MAAGNGTHRIEGGLADQVMDKVADWAVACEESGGEGFPTEAHMSVLEASLSDIVPEPDDMGAALRAVKGYVGILGDALGPDIPVYAVDIKQSALLRRLLAGKLPLDEAPPRDGQRPWYELVEQPGPHACAVGDVTDLSSVLGDRNPGDDGMRLVVNRVPWNLVGEIEGGGWMVRWQGRGPLHAVRPAGDGWTIERAAGP